MCCFQDFLCDRGHRLRATVLNIVVITRDIKIIGLLITTNQATINHSSNWSVISQSINQSINRSRIDSATDRIAMTTMTTATTTTRADNIFSEMDDSLCRLNNDVNCRRTVYTKHNQHNACRRRVKKFIKRITNFLVPIPTINYDPLIACFPPSRNVT